MNAGHHYSGSHPSTARCLSDHGPRHNPVVWSLFRRADRSARSSCRPDRRHRHPRRPSQSGPRHIQPAGGRLRQWPGWRLRSCFLLQTWRAPARRSLQPEASLKSRIVAIVRHWTIGIRKIAEVTVPLATAPSPRPTEPPAPGSRARPSGRPVPLPPSGPVRPRWRRPAGRCGDARPWSRRRAAA